MSSARYKAIPRKGLYLANHSHLSSHMLLRAGDLIGYRESYADGTHGHRLARALDLVTHDHNGQEFRETSTAAGKTRRAPRVRVYAFDNMLSFGYERWVALADIVKSRAPSSAHVNFARWLLGGPMPKPETIFAASKYGVLSEAYYHQVANAEGWLGEDWRERRERYDEGRRRKVPGFT
jgi:hypothetical protein